MLSESIMWGLAFYSHMENNYITTSFHQEGRFNPTTCYWSDCIKPGKWAIMYTCMCVKGIDIAYFYNFALGFWNCSDYDCGIFVPPIKLKYWLHIQSLIGTHVTISWPFDWLTPITHNPICNYEKQIQTCNRHAFRRKCCFLFGWTSIVYICYILFIGGHRGRDRITTDVVSSNLDQGEVYNIMW
jgi:hypothetical protein